MDELVKFTLGPVVKDQQWLSTCHDSIPDIICASECTKIISRHSHPVLVSRSVINPALSSSTWHSHRVNHLTSLPSLTCVNKCAKLI